MRLLELLVDIEDWSSSAQSGLIGDETDIVSGNSALGIRTAAQKLSGDRQDTNSNNRDVQKTFHHRHTASGYISDEFDAPMRGLAKPP
jgi:hypothetical protein